MEILHLSDLHITHPYQSLEQVWEPAERILTQLGCDRKHFHFVVVTGDLSQAAEESEYAKLLSFANTKLLRLLCVDDRRRIIFVPGNHDVDWTAKIAQPWQFSQLASRKNGSRQLEWLREQLEKLNKSPTESELRWVTSPLGHHELMRLSFSPTPDAADVHYVNRFRNVQKFLDDFYDGARPEKHFDLLSEGDDWSEHHFLDEKIAFFGFNTCHRNDPFWHGAHFNPQTLVKARTRARRLAAEHRDLTLAAVWHHGMTADQLGRPDYLTTRDVSAFSDTGFRVAFHGHTHRAEIRVSELFNKKMAISATGSLGAGAKERPEAVTNQFSIVRLFRNRLIVKVYDFDPAKQAYTSSIKNENTVRYFIPPRAAVEEAKPCSAKTHERRWVVGKEGIATVTVTLRELNVGSGVPLAVIHPPFCNVVESRTASSGANGPPIKISRKDLPDGSVFCYVDPKENSNPSKYAALQWEYKISSALALTRGDLKLLQPRTPWHPLIDEFSDVLSYRPRFDCEQLDIHLEFAADSEASIQKAHQLVERRAPGFGTDLLELVEEEMERCTLELVDDRRRAHLRVEDPIVDYRYSIVYEPGAEGEELPDEAQQLGLYILKECRSVLPSKTSLSSYLCNLFQCNFRISDVRSSTPNGEQPISLLGERSTWTAAIWDPKWRRLYNTYGEFRPQSWAQDFYCGWGVAGHAFRFSNIAAWHQKWGDRPIIFRDRSTQAHPYHDEEEHPYSWMLCVPLRVRRTGPSIGVIGFAGRDDPTPLGKWLDELAYAQRKFESLRTSVVLKADDKSFMERIEVNRQELWTAVESQFWSAVSSWPNLTNSGRQFVGDVIRNLRGP